MVLKRTLTAAIAMLLSFSSLSAFAAAKDIIINGEIAEIPKDMGSIREMDDRTFVPIRFIMEHLGCHVDFDDAAKMATISSETCAYMIQDGNPVLYTVPYSAPSSADALEAGRLAMDTVPFIDNEEGRMYIPIRFLAEAIGYTVGWDEVTEIVTLTIAE